MKCLILAAGYATRLYPITENYPKPLLDVAGKTIIDWLIDDIDSAGIIDEYVVISNNRFYEHFLEWSKAKLQRITVVNDGTNSNDTRLGAVCDIDFAIDSLGIDDDLLIIAGDNVLDFSLVTFLNYAIEKGSSCIMRYFEPLEKKLSKSGVVYLGSDDRVVDMQEKPDNPKSNWCAPPFYYYTKNDSRKIKQAIKDGCGTDAPGSLVSWLCKNSTVYALEMPGKRYDIGTLESYKEIKENYRGIK